MNTPMTNDHIRDSSIFKHRLLVMDLYQQRPTTSYLIDFVNILLSNCFLVILGDEGASTTSTAWVEGHQLRLLHTNTYIDGRNPAKHLGSISHGVRGPHAAERIWNIGSVTAWDPSYC